MIGKRRLPGTGVTNHGLLSGSQNIVINGGTFNETTEASKEWMNLLRSNTAAGAYHNSGERRDPPKCHPGTREVVNREIMDWVRGNTRAPSERFLWIYGPAGTGKSSIAQTIAEICEKEGLLASDFFFLRTVSERNNETKLIPTLAYQLTVSVPDVRTYIAAAIDSDPLIFTRSLRNQLEAIILKPLIQLLQSESSSGRQYPSLIIIDGLDECGTQECQHNILSSFSLALRDFPAPVIFIIASRPEYTIREAFNSSLHPFTRRIVLDEQYNPDDDIRTFLYSKFNFVKERHPMAASLPCDWPLDSEVESIVRKASGQFIYASTVMKFVASRKLLPRKALQIVLSLTTCDHHRPFADLDALYTSILKSLDEVNLDKALTFFAFHFVTSYLVASSNTQIEQTMELVETFLGYETGELSIILDDLHSIVDVPPTPSGDIRLYHASLGDFFLDRTRSKDLYIDIGRFSTKFIKTVIKHLTPRLRAPVERLQKLSQTERYCCCIFMELFDAAKHDRDLLKRLSKPHFPIKNLVQFMFSRIHTTDIQQMLSDIHHFLDWIQCQDQDLYNVYSSHFDDYLKSRILANPRHPQWQHIFTALTLHSHSDVNFEGDNLKHLCSLFDESSTFFYHFFGSPLDVYIPPGIHLSYFFGRLSALLTDPQVFINGKYFNVNTSSYIRLATELFDFFTVSEKAPEALNCTAGCSMATNLFLATLEKIPAEQKLRKHLRDLQRRDFSPVMKHHEPDIRSSIRNYIKSCDIHEEMTSSPLSASVVPPSISAAGANPEPEVRLSYASTVTASISSYTDTDHREERESKSSVNDRQVFPQPQPQHRFRFPPLPSSRSNRESDRTGGLTFGTRSPEGLNKRRKKRHMY